MSRPVFVELFSELQVDLYMALTNFDAMNYFFP